MPDFKDFKAHLENQDRAPATIKSYLSDLRQFARWFAQTNGQELTLPAVTALDVRDYRQALLTVQQRQASTVNRHLASLSTWLAWGVTTGQIEYQPAEAVKGVAQVALSPQWLSRADEGALLRQVERAWQTAQTVPAQRQAARNRALVVLLLNTGLRAAEACHLKLGDVELSDRKGAVHVRQGKGRKQRQIPLNKQARHPAMLFYLDNYV